MADPVRESATLEAVAAQVHAAWTDAKRAAGVTSRPSADGIEQMVPYDDLPEHIKALDRATVRAVLDALTAAGYTLAGPGEVVVRLPEPHIVSVCNCGETCVVDDPDDRSVDFDGMVNVAVGDVYVGDVYVWPMLDSTAGPWMLDEAEKYGLALVAAARYARGTSPAEPTTEPGCDDCPQDCKYCTQDTASCECYAHEHVPMEHPAGEAS